MADASISGSLVPPRFRPIESPSIETFVPESCEREYHSETSNKSPIPYRQQSGSVPILQRKKLRER